MHNAVVFREKGTQLKFSKELFSLSQASAFHSLSHVIRFLNLIQGDLDVEKIFTCYYCTHLYLKLLFGP